MKIFFMGPPGCGKGTQSKKIAETYSSFIRLDMGNLLRSSQSKVLQDDIAQGKFISNDQLTPLVDNFLQGRKEDIIFDGIPRTYEQCTWLERKGLIPDIVFLFFLSKEEVAQRIDNRYIHLKSGRTYNSILNPPKIPMIDDITGERLERRVDDQEGSVLTERILAYEKNKEAIINWFFDIKVPLLVYVDGKRDIQSTHQYIQKIINKFSE